MMRFRDDKPNGNFKSVVENIIQSIEEGVEKDAVSLIAWYASRALTSANQLLARSAAIRDAWKARHLSGGSTVAPPPAPRPPPTAASPIVGGEIRFGPLGPSRWSKVSGPLVVAGVSR